MRLPGTAILAAFILTASAASAAEMKIVRVFSGWRDAASFKRISEYFDGKENTGGETVLRTQPGQRGGYYFLVRIANTGAPLEARLVLQVITPAAPAARTHAFQASLPAGQTVLNLGITGGDWPDPKTNALAWKLDVLDASGRVLATEKSYLWERPMGG